MLYLNQLDYAHIPYHNIPEREGRVNDAAAPFLYCDVNTVHAETKPGRVKYHLFERRK